MKCFLAILLLSGVQLQAQEPDIAIKLKLNYNYKPTDYKPTDYKPTDYKPTESKVAPKEAEYIPLVKPVESEAEMKARLKEEVRKEILAEMKIQSQPDTNLTYEAFEGQMYGKLPGCTLQRVNGIVCNVPTQTNVPIQTNFTYPSLLGAGNFGTGGCANGTCPNSTSRFIRR